MRLFFFYEFSANFSRKKDTRWIDFFTNEAPFFLFCFLFLNPHPLWAAKSKKKSYSVSGGSAILVSGQRELGDWMTTDTKYRPTEIFLLAHEYLYIEELARMPDVRTRMKTGSRLPSAMILFYCITLRSMQNLTATNWPLTHLKQWYKFNISMNIEIVTLKI